MKSNGFASESTDELTAMARVPNDENAFARVFSIELGNGGVYLGETLVVVFWRGIVILGGIDSEEGND